MNLWLLAVGGLALVGLALTLVEVSFWWEQRRQRRHIKARLRYYRQWQDAPRPPAPKHPLPPGGGWYA